MPSSDEVDSILREGDNPLSECGVEGSAARGLGERLVHLPVNDLDHPSDGLPVGRRHERPWRSSSVTRGPISQVVQVPKIPEDDCFWRKGAPLSVPID